MAEYQKKHAEMRKNTAKCASRNAPARGDVQKGHKMRIQRCWGGAGAAPWPRAALLRRSPGRWLDLRELQPAHFGGIELFLELAITRTGRLEFIGRERSAGEFGFEIGFFGLQRRKLGFQGL